MSWADHTPECWNSVPPENGYESQGRNAGLRWLLPPAIDGKPKPLPIVAFLNFNACAAVDHWSGENLPPELQPRGIHFPRGENLAAAGYLFGPPLASPLECHRIEQAGTAG